MRPAARPSVVLALLALVLLTSVEGRGTQAAFSDRAPVTTGAVTAGTVAPVTNVTCNAGLGLLGATVSWTGASNRDYVLEFYNASTGALVDTRTTTGTSYSVDITNVGLLTAGTWRVAVRARLSGTQWVAASAPSRNVGITTSLIYSCP